MAKIILIISILIFTGCASWSTQDKALMGSFVASQAISGAQIHHANNTNGIHEQNGIYKDCEPEGIALFKLLGIGAVYGLSELLPDYKTEILIGANVIGWGFVIKDQIVIEDN